MNCVRITIGGCRDFEDYEVFTGFVSECIEKMKPRDRIIILSGHCKGTDLMAEKYADEMGYEIEIHTADWKKYGRAAGPKRNAEMIQNSNAVIAFWDGKSRGTKNLLEYAKKKSIPIYEKNI